MCPNFFTARPPRSRTSRKRRDRLLNILLYPCPLVFYIDSSSGLTYSLHLLDRSLLLSRTGSPLWFSPLLLANVLTNVFIEPKKRSRCWETHGGGESRSVSHARSQRRRSFESRPATIVEFSLSLSLSLSFCCVFAFRWSNGKRAFRYFRGGRSLSMSRREMNLSAPEVQRTGSKLRRSGNYDILRALSLLDTLFCWIHTWRCFCTKALAVWQSFSIQAGIFRRIRYGFIEMTTLRNYLLR